MKKEDLDGKSGASVKYESITRYMARDLITFSPETEMIEVIETMLRERFSGAPVLDGESLLVGLISEKDCLKIMIDSVYHNQPISKSKVKKYMTTDIKTINVNSDIVDAANEFHKTRYKRFPVVDDSGKLIGQISRRDILSAIKNMNVSSAPQES